MNCTKRFPGILLYSRPFPGGQFTNSLFHTFEFTGTQNCQSCFKCQCFIQGHYHVVNCRIPSFTLLRKLFTSNSPNRFAVTIINSEPFLGSHLKLAVLHFVGHSAVPSVVNCQISSFVLSRCKFSSNSQYRFSVPIFNSEPFLRGQLPNSQL